MTIFRLPVENRRLLRLFLLAILTGIVLFAPSHGGSSLVKTVTAQDIPTFPESQDFATASMQNAWDMTEFRDISQYLNRSGQANLVADVHVENGVFSARSTRDKDAQFFPLFPGYMTAMLLGTVGHNYPIPSDVYQCLYAAMRVDSAAASTQGAEGQDMFQAFWFEDERLNGGVWGMTKGIVLYPEAGLETPTHTWKLYKVDLGSDSTFWSGARWKDRPLWRGLRIDPTLMYDIPFAVDWVRLTPCDPIPFPIQWTGADPASIWIQPEGASHEILVASKVTGSSYNFDLQGFAPGVYTYRVKGGQSIVASGEFRVNDSPTGSFVIPSPTSGTDYAAQAGNPWDFTDSSDFTRIYNMSYSVDGGTLNLVSPSGADPIVELNTPVPIARSTDYRYLTFRMHTDRPWQNIPEGMIVRWGWQIPGASGRDGYVCHIMSQDIPFDVGWDTVTIDLHDPFNGSAEETAGDCSGLPLHWASDSSVLQMRLDPNENILGVNLYQKLDNVQLTKQHSVVKGQPFPVQVQLDKSPETLKSARFFYTSNLQEPTQNLAIDWAVASAQDPGATDPTAQPSGNRVFLPLTLNNPSVATFLDIPNSINYSWDTSDVTPGEYYLCVETDDEYNKTVFCSGASVRVVAP